MQNKILAISLALGLVLFAGSPTPFANDCNCYDKTYTLDADFDEGTLVNVNHDSPNNDQLQLNSVGEAFDFIWVAASARGTIVRIDTLTGQVLGEYRSAPEERGLNPSRTTVDAGGNVWSGNRDEGGPIGGIAHGSVVKIGLVIGGTRVDSDMTPNPAGDYLMGPFGYNTCEDRNSDGLLYTSSGLGDIRPWPDVTDGVGGTDNVADDARVQDAEDECILVYQRLPDAGAARHVSVDGNNDVWVGGYPFDQRSFHKLDNTTGAILASFDARRFGCGGYGGLIDGNGILWSASITQSELLRYDPSADTGTCIPVSSSYGLGIDTNGFIWNSMWINNSIVKVSPAGGIEPGFPKTTDGASGDRGVAVTPADNNVWVANSGGSDVSRLDNNGNLLAVIPVGITPTGVAVDAAGKVWVTNLASNNAMRIDPATNLVDLTVDLGVGAGPYNYSDMTGSTLTAPPGFGTWTVIYDSLCPGSKWTTVSWNSNEPGDSSIVVEVASSDDGVTFGPAVVATNGDPLTIADGQYLKVVVTFERSTEGDSPILYDLTIECNEPPDCSNAAPSIETIWPPNHKFVDISVIGVTDPEGDPITITIDGIFQDEPVDTFGDGSFTPDGQGVGSETAEVRAERSGTKIVPGDGRVYHIFFTADDGAGGSCSGEVSVGVPHDVKDTPVDGGALFDSTTLSP